jgi:hypothetical protein
MLKLNLCNASGAEMWVCGVVILLLQGLALLLLFGSRTANLCVTTSPY